MLAFMRKHQKYFYVIITIVICISFSFFGTYSTLSGNSIHELTAFTTVNGDPVTRLDLEEMALFLGTDSNDKKLFGGIWGPNFLNNGVIQKDFLETGLGAILAENYPDDLQGDLKNRLAREIRFSPYVHPKVPFLSSMNVWSYFAPAIAENLQVLKGAKDPLTKEALDARVQLFLAERRFPSPYLNQMLRLQEKQNRSIPHDPALDELDLSLFGYHTVDDWFGGKFVRLISQFIYNAAAIAEQRGYFVSKEEALADLKSNAEASFKENRDNPRLGVANSGEYFEQQLLRLRLDKTKAVKLWQKVLLFRRLFGDVASSVFVDPLPYQTFDQFSGVIAEGDLYRLPSVLRFSDFKTLQRFETYLDAVSKRDRSEKNALLLPKTFLTPEEVAKKTPELVQKKYLLEVASADKRALQNKVSVKDTLAWELDENNWKALRTQFPELGLKKSDTREQRLAAVDEMDSITRSRADQFTRKEIAAAHPEWIVSALELATPQNLTAALSLKGGNPSFEGLQNGEDLMKLLDKAETRKLSPSLEKVSFDGEHFYRITVLERSQNLEVLTFEQANQGSGIDNLNRLLDHALEVAYVTIRSEHPEDYQNSDTSWKPFEEVKEQVALAKFSKILDGIKAELKKHEDQDKYQHLTQDRLTPYRFIGEAETLKQQLKKNPQAASDLTLSEDGKSLNDQFKWVKSPLQLSRKTEHNLAQGDKLFNQTPKTWSPVVLAPNGDMYFSWVEARVNAPVDVALVQQQVDRARFLLGNDAERTYLNALLPELKDKHAISFDYLYTGENTIEPESQS
jgi:GcvH upstream region-like protein